MPCCQMMGCGGGLRAIERIKVAQDALTVFDHKPAGVTKSLRGYRCLVRCRHAARQGTISLQKWSFNLLGMVSRHQERECLMLQSQVTPFISSNPEDSPRDSKRCERMLAVLTPQHERSVD